MPAHLFSRWFVVAALALPAAGLCPAQDDGRIATLEEVRAALLRGADYLVRTQNPDGSWGSHRDALPGYDDIFMHPETHRGWQVATTGLCCMALQNVEETESVRAAFERGLEFICTNADLRRSNDWDIDAAWGFIFGLQGLAQARVDPRLAGSPLLEKLDRAGATLIDRLEKYQTPSGGWGYYEGEAITFPSSWATSFATASAVLALLDARQAGWTFDEKMLARAVQAVQRCRLPNGAYSYSVDTIPTPRHGEGINHIKGSLGRTQVCNLALRRAGIELSSDEVKRGIENFFRYHRFLDIARGRPIPHEAYYANAAYFYCYAHCYAAGLIATLPREHRQQAWPRLRHEIVKTQVADGSMWDYYMNTYGKPYGTAFSMIALSQSLMDEN